MKNIATLLIAFMFSVSAFADATEVPAYLKDAVITVTLTNGKVYTFSANTHAVVVRASSNKKKPTETAVVEKKVETEKPSKQTCEEAGFRKQKMNRVRVMGGRGPDGVQADVGTTTTVVTQSQGPVGGISYDRSIDDTISVGGQIMTNGTGTVGVGVDF